jgi:hypothetical protein
MDARTEARGADIQKAARYLAEGRAREAAGVLEDLARTFPAYVTAHVLLAKAYETEGRDADALEAWHRAYFLMPGSPLIVRQRSRLLQLVALPRQPEPHPAPRPPAGETMDIAAHGDDTWVEVESTDVEDAAVEPSDEPVRPFDTEDASGVELEASMLEDEWIALPDPEDVARSAGLESAEEPGSDTWGEEALWVEPPTSADSEPPAGSGADPRAQPGSWDEATDLPENEWVEPPLAVDSEPQEGRDAETGAREEQPAAGPAQAERAESSFPNDLAASAEHETQAGPEPPAEPESARPPVWYPPPGSGDSTAGAPPAWEPFGGAAGTEDGWRIVGEGERAQDDQSEVEGIVQPPSGTGRHRPAPWPADEPEAFTPGPPVEGSGRPDSFDAPPAAEPPAGETPDPDAAAETVQRPAGEPAAEDFMDDVADLDTLIERLETAPRIRPSSAEDDGDLDDALGDDEVVSETLARIYEAQRQWAAAARSYDLLARQHPERAEEFRRRAAEARQKGRA